MMEATLEWQDCDVESHDDDCFMAITEDGLVLRDCEDM